MLDMRALRARRIPEDAVNQTSSGQEVTDHDLQVRGSNRHVVVGRIGGRSGDAAAHSRQNRDVR